MVSLRFPCFIGISHFSFSTPAKSAEKNQWDQQTHVHARKSRHVWQECSFQGRGVGVYILKPPPVGIYTPPSFICPPPNSRVFSGVFGTNVYETFNERPRTHPIRTHPKAEFLQFVFPSPHEAAVFPSAAECTMRDCDLLTQTLSILVKETKLLLLN